MTSRLHLPRRLASEPQDNITGKHVRAFYRATGAFYCLLNIPDGAMSFQVPDYDALGTLASAMEGGEPKQVPVVQFRLLNIQPPNCERIQIFVEQA